MEALITFLDFSRRNIGQTWDNILTQDKYTYNDTQNRSTCKSPFEIDFEICPRGILELRDLERLQIRVVMLKIFPCLQRRFIIQ